ncbi:tetratricopeptide repeat protein [Pseudomonas schmalbachii]|uniref:Tetratricopeptide repeat protein n=1 Tax=Pseudomonas schmalbachii TaxID=2816993 RepID=A0ABS3TZ46_9PSED|nr:tetratricopeptide repeat protein [Pseudomonas schmalbachii]MBO3277950.1 tetratricopeptide repeat protein [Pseudomonas schmalbachii]
MSKPDKKKSPNAAPGPLARRIYLGVACLLLLASGGAWWYVQNSTPTLPPALPQTPPPTAIKPVAPIKVDKPATMVAEQQCQGCHQGQFQDWQRSHHQRAMQEPTAETVLGNFSGVTFKGTTETTRFFQKDGAFWVNTPGADGKPADFKVAYTFGIEPLQQYLLEYPGGRLQALGVAWDTQKKRWFELMPGERIDHKDELHWTRPAQNANFMCVECHTTGFKRNFDAQTDSFASRWDALGVGCQSCHGPASKHLEWAARPDRDSAKGFDMPLKGSDKVTLVETCGRCHARRAPLADGFEQKHRLMDDYLPSNLTRELYQLDGKIKDEVFEYGSFVQSKMFAKGVKCTDCHNPHSGELKAPGNGVCLQCHNTAGKPTRPEIDGSGLQAKNYDSPEHHHHQPGTPGAQCTSCHMPGKFYMVNDYRHDHGFTIPNPLHAQKLGTPDACLSCHADKASSKVAEQFRLWYASPAADKPAPSSNPAPRYDDTVAKARDGLPGASRALHLLLESADLPAIRRATLLAELPRYPSQRSMELAAIALNNKEPQVRHAAVEAVGQLAPPQQQASLLLPRLSDPVRAVRIATAWQLAQLPPQLRAGFESMLAKGLEEYESVQLSLAERAEANLNRALLYQATNRANEVEPALRAALKRNPGFLPALVSLSQWLENNYRTDEARQLLDEAIRQHPKSGLLQHARGLALVRKGERPQALAAFKEAVRLSPDDDQFRFVLAIALHDSGQQEEASKQLEQLLKRNPTNRSARLTLADYLRESGQMQKVQMLMAELEQQNPDDPALRRE